MSDFIGHKCGIALVRLKRPLETLREHRGDLLWGLRRLYLLMEKQRNRGQDGAGIATVKFDMPAGEPFLMRLRSAKRNPVERLFDDALTALVSHRVGARRAREPLSRGRRSRVYPRAQWTSTSSNSRRWRVRSAVTTSRRSRSRAVIRPSPSSGA